MWILLHIFKICTTWHILCSSEDLHFPDMGEEDILNRHHFLWLLAHCLQLPDIKSDEVHSHNCIFCSPNMSIYRRGGKNGKICLAVKPPTPIPTQLLCSGLQGSVAEVRLIFIAINLASFSGLYSKTLLVLLLANPT